MIKGSSCLPVQSLVWWIFLILSRTLSLNSLFEHLWEKKPNKRKKIKVSVSTSHCWIPIFYYCFTPASYFRCSTFWLTDLKKTHIHTQYKSDGVTYKKDFCRVQTWHKNPPVLHLIFLFSSVKKAATLSPRSTFIFSLTNENVLNLFAAVPMALFSFSSLWL